VPKTHTKILFLQNRKMKLISKPNAREAKKLYAIFELLVCAMSVHQDNKNTHTRAQIGRQIM